MFNIHNNLQICKFICNFALAYAKTMKRSLLILFSVWFCALSIHAQDSYNPDDLKTSAGTEFYFAIPNLWQKNPNPNQDVLQITICTTEATTVVITSGSRSNSASIPANSSQSFYYLSSEVSPYQGIHITSTKPCYVSVWVHGENNAASSSILPVHLLGTRYITHTPEIILCTVRDGTTVHVNGQTSYLEKAGSAMLFTVQSEEENPPTVITSDKPIAVFQGRENYCSSGSCDGEWEQARPVSSWGKEFIIPKSGLFKVNIAKITASEDNTEVYLEKGLTQGLKVLNAGETYERTIISDVPELAVHHLRTTKPVSCYIYLRDAQSENGVGDPGIAEIIPIDSAATEARWSIDFTTYNSPYTTRLIITTRTENADYVKLNGQKLSIPMYDGRTRYDSDGYSTWEIPIDPAGSGIIKAEKGTFSAYIVHVGKIEEAALFNISLPFTQEPPEPLCTEGMLLFREDFGGNDPNDPEVSTTPVPGMSYTQLKSNAFGDMAPGKYLVTKKGYRNSSYSNYSVWHIMDDHTYFDDYERGYCMEIDGKGDNAEFYKTTLDGLCAGSKLTFSAWVANLTTAGQYNGWRDDRDYVHPKLTFCIVNKDTREVIAEYNTDTIAHDWSLFGVSNAWQQSAHWQQVGMNFIVPEGVSAVELSIRNAVYGNAAGNDFAIDDIEVRICLPEPFILAPDTVCIDSKYTMEVQLQNDSLLPEPREYRWFYSADSITWTAIPNSNTTSLKRKAKPDQTGWYQVAVAAPGGAIESPNCRATSEPFHLYVIPDCPPILCADGILLFREDFGGNDPNDPRISTTPVPGMTYNQLTDDRFGSMRSGSYLVTKSGYCNGDTTSSNQPQNRRSQWHLQDDHTYPGDYSRGYFMEVDGKGDNAAFYTTTIDGLCAGTDLSFIAYVANVVTWGQYTGRPGYFAYPRLLFRLTNPDNGQELAAYDTGEIPFDSTFMGDYKCWQYSSKWHQVGMNFTVPENISSVKLTIYNNSQGTIGNDFAIDDIEIRLCLDPVYVSGTSPACRKKQQTLWAMYDNWGTILSPEYQWYYANDSIGPYAAIEGETKNYYRIPIVHKSHEGWYRVAVAEEGHTADEHCRSMSKPFHLLTQYCNTATEQQIDTTVCDTLLAEPYVWRGHEWTAVGMVTDTLKDFEDDDSVYVHLHMHDKQCCPDIQTVYADSAVCDTLLPFLWMYRDTMLLFEHAGVQEFIRPHAKWINCDGTNYVLRLDTFHCERFYPIIVNKYNWQLVCDNVALRRFFPDNKALAFQWYKNGEPIPGANEDDYAEQNELNGIFQLQIRLDAPVDNDDEYIWSNILEIGEVQAPEPIVKKVYHWWSLTIIRYQQGDRVWYEKKLR